MYDNARGWHPAHAAIITEYYKEAGPLDLDAMPSYLLVTDWLGSFTVTFTYVSVFDGGMETSCDAQLVTPILAIQALNKRLGIQ